MHPIDWLIVIVFTLITIVVGLYFSKKASQGGLDSFFASNRSLSWWLAGTSMIATAFSTDTPLMVTGLVRAKGIWGNWQIWCLAISTMFTVFFFSRFWKRAGVLTEVALVELRYSGRPAAFLRGFKAIYWGVFYNCFVMGAWPVTGLVKIMQETTGWDKTVSIFFAFGLTTVYACFSGYWGVVFTDLFQFFWMMIGAIVLAVYAVGAVGGLDALVTKLSMTDKLNILPPLTETHGFWDFLSSPVGWFLGLIMIQWWAWKNTDGGGMIVQRMVSTKDEKEALYATLWFNVAQYALRVLPWVLTALASIILIPDALLTVKNGAQAFVDHERAYPRLVTMLLPIGIKGFVVASFFAAFMSTIDSHLNWGSSYFVNDFYKRFLVKKASDRHYIWVSRILPIFLAAGAVIVAFHINSIYEVFDLILNFTAGIGPVYFLRWFWWRINPWSEVVAMVASLPVILLRPLFFKFFGIPPSLPLELLVMVLGTAMFWVPATFLTAPVEEGKLRNFFEKVNPPGFWKGWNRGLSKKELIEGLSGWIIGTLALFLTTFGSLELFIGKRQLGIVYLLISLIGWWWVLRKFSFKKSGSYSQKSDRHLER